MALMFFQQFSGVNAVLAYAVQLFEDTGVTQTIDAYTCNILVCLTQFVFVIVSMLLVDRNVESSFFTKYFTGTSMLQVWQKNPLNSVGNGDGGLNDRPGRLLCGQESARLR